ncbi:MAG: molybdopterin-dependent oxidoreductase [Actinobacteria bacterium]|nr:molybdopterin-dependent oxidoreductase [Actinomycetota bacterium]
MTTTIERPVEPEVAAAPRPIAFPALAGLLAGAGALVSAELASRIVPGAVSPVVAVGNRAVELTPDSLRRASIAAFGTMDKPLLLGGILLVVGLLAALCGVLAVRRRLAAELMIVGLGLVVVLACVLDTGANLAGALLVGAVTVAVGVGLLRWLTVPAVVPAVEGDAVPVDEGDAVPAAGGDAPAAGVNRRHFLRRTAIVGLATVSAGGLLRMLDAHAQVSALRAALGLPAPARLAPGDLAAADLGVAGITPVVTPNASFYRIDTALLVPQVDPRTYSVAIGGMVDTPFSLTYEELLAMPQVEADITIQCVSNEVGGDLIGHARWQGVLLRDVLAMAGVQPGADQIVGTSVDGWTGGFPTSYGLDDRNAMIALGMNGEPLPVIHGFPARLIVPGLYGYVSATKWLESITLTTLAGFDGFWIPRGWGKFGPIKIASRIDVPRSFSTVAAGPVTVGGMAWAPGLGRGITAVEARVDGGAWQAAELGGELSEDAWRQWRWTWDATPGDHVLEVRAVDSTGEVQTEVVAPVLPDGASGYHAIKVKVA